VGCCWERRRRCEVHDDETAATAVAVLRRAVAWFAARGVRTERVLTDKRQPVPLARVAGRLRRAGHHAQANPPLPAQTNCKIERFHRALADGWAFARMFLSESARRKALPAWAA
jgi:hypothetical protein